MKKEHENPKYGYKTKYGYLPATFCLLFLSFLFCIVMVFYYRGIGTTIRKQAQEVLQSSSQRNSRILVYEINNKMTLFQRIAGQYRAEIDADKEETLQKLEPLLELYDFKDVGFILEDGKAYSVKGDTYDFSETDFFQRAMEGQVEITPTMTDQKDGKKINLYSAPIAIQGKISGAIYAVYETDHLISLLSSSFQGGSYSYVVDSGGEVMMAENGNYQNIMEGLEQDNKENLGEAEKMAGDLLQGREGTITCDSDGKKYAYYCPLGINDWFLVTVVPVEAANQRYAPIMDSTRWMYVLIGVIFFLAAALIVRQQKKQNKRLEYYAYVDPMTGGMNNTSFMLAAVETLRKQKESKAAVLAVDINHFKLINELLGVKAGNETICRLEQALRENCREDELVGHRIADRFTVLWLYREHEELLERLEQMQQCLKKLSENMGNIHFKAAIGVYEITEKEREEIDSVQMERICGSAMQANQTLKDGHETAFCFSDETLRNRQLMEKIYEDQMYPALERKEFVPWFQPKVRIEDGSICGAEALVRWKKQDGSLIPPGEFIPFFETNGFIEKVDRAMMEAVCQFQSQWKERGLRTVPVSVNLSRTYLYSENFAREWSAYLEKHQLSTKDIQFEVTETFAERDREQLRKVIRALHEEGFTVLLDDFGTGYSSMQSLQELEFDVLKLDCEFTWGIGRERTEKILDATIALAKALDMATIAEGVETETQYRYLKEHGVTEAQGYFYYKPMPAEEFEKLLAYV